MQISCESLTVLNSVNCLLYLYNIKNRKFLTHSKLRQEPLLNNLIQYFLYFLTKSARARTHLLRSFLNCILQLQYKLVSSHAKNQPPRTMLSYV